MSAGEGLGPLPEDVEALLQQAGTPEPSAAFSKALSARLETRIGAGAPTAATAGQTALGASALSSGTWLALVGTALAAGVGLGVAAGRTLWPPPERVVIQEVVRAKEVVRFMPAPPPPVAPPRRPEVSAAGGRDAQLALERALVDEARSALARGDGAAALAALERHAAKFAGGSLVEERLGLEVVALAQQGRTDEARDRARRFQELYPGSIFKGVVEAASPPP